MARVAAPPLPLAGLAPCLARAGLTWERAAARLRISPATLHSYASRGAPLGMIAALTLLLDLPNHSPRPLFVRPPEGLKARTAPESHRARPHQPALRRAEERPSQHSAPTPPSTRPSDANTGGAAVWQQLPLSRAGS